MPRDGEKSGLDLEAVSTIGVVGAGYVLLRLVGRIAGGRIDARMAGSPPLHTRWIGVALVPQAGVALGMALVASIHFPERREPLLAITIGTTVVFQLFGPLLTQLALHRVGEAK